MIDGAERSGCRMTTVKWMSGGIEDVFAEISTSSSTPRNLVARHADLVGADLWNGARTYR
jgi:hypothetical protein